MIFHRKLSALPHAPIADAAGAGGMSICSRLVTCWQTDAVGRLVPIWKLVIEPGGEPPG